VLVINAAGRGFHHPFTGPHPCVTVFGTADRCTFDAEIDGHPRAATKLPRLSFDALDATGRQVPTERLLIKDSN